MREADFFPTEMLGMTKGARDSIGAGEREEAVRVICSACHGKRSVTIPLLASKQTRTNMWYLTPGKPTQNKCFRERKCGVMAPAPITDDYYMILDVEQSASSEAITKSYKRLALLRHPDRNTRHDTTEAFQLVRNSHFSLMFALFMEMTR